MESRQGVPSNRVYSQPRDRFSLEERFKEQLDLGDLANRCLLQFFRRRLILQLGAVLLVQQTIPVVFLCRVLFVLLADVADHSNHLLRRTEKHYGHDFLQASLLVTLTNRIQTLAGVPNSACATRTELTDLLK